MGGLVLFPEGESVCSAASRLTLDERKLAVEAMIMDWSSEQVSVVEAIAPSIDQTKDPTTLAMLRVLLQEDAWIITNQLDGTFLGVFSDALGRLPTLIP